eukprot:Rhum_TRINITY_DN19171_c0_g1::Rhum_TRINITY_DN19171_c0_g1_i1::g.169424::m.169424/K08059/IFI30, GILT; interferon, gamma-inducible protein 30
MLLARAAATVLLVSSSLVHAQAGAPLHAKVQIKMYAEAYCTDCIHALQYPVKQTLEAAGVWDIVDYELIPYGNAFQLIDQCNKTDAYFQRKCYIDHCVGVDKAARPADCFDRPVICQDGPEECWRNTVEACIIEQTHGDPRAYLPFVWCYIKTGHPSAVRPPSRGAGHAADKYLTECAAAAGLDAAKAFSCASSTHGRSLITTAARRTADLGPERSYVPYILVNGRVVPQADQAKLLDIVCREYTGDKPKGCPQ